MSRPSALAAFPVSLDLVRQLPRSRRARLSAPALRGDQRLLRLTAEQLRRIPGVVKVAGDVRSGRILVITDGSARLEPLLRPRSSPSPSRGPAVRWSRKEAVAERPWHALPVADVLAALGTSEGGLEPAEARRRLRRYGDNALDRVGPRSRIALFASQLANVPSALLLGSATISTTLRELVDAAAILGVLGLNTAIGYRVERSSERLLQSWRSAEAGEASLLRGRRLKRVSTIEIVPGDVLVLRAGDVVPADARVIESHRLACDEAPLTGESEPRAKQHVAVAADSALGDRDTMVWAGTTVVAGRGRAVVVATGAATEMARVRRLIDESAAPETPLARRLARLGRRVAAGAVGGAAVQALAGLAHGRPALELVRGAVALGLAALPEGLPVVSTAALVRSMARMRKDGMVVRRISSAETLGGVTVICTDKTGTLTQNDMQLELCVAGGAPQPASELHARPERLFTDRVTLLLAAALLNSDVDVHERGHEILAISGSSTERALVMAAHAAGLDGEVLRRDFPTRRLDEREPGVHYVVSVHGRPGGGRVAFVKGAPDQVLALCDGEHADGDEAGDCAAPAAAAREPARARPLSAQRRAELLARNEELAAAGLRVLGVAWRPLGAHEHRPRDGFTWLGMVALRDPLRPGAADAIADAARAGIRTIIVTGDQRSTAAAIARQLGLDGEALDGAEMVALACADTAAARERLSRLAVLSRVTPADKLRLVQALRQAGEVVAMAGDGINDAPALKVADVGVAVGRNASDLARHVADVVLAGDDLRAILAAVAEGRIVQDNLRRALRFLFATNLSEMLLMVGAALVGARDPLTPLQLLWINMLTDTLPALALALEPGDRSVLDRPPARPRAAIFTRAQRWTIVRDGALLALAGAAGGIVGGPPLAFSTLAGAQLSYTLSCRAGDRPPTARFGTLVGGTVGVQLLGLTLPPLRALLGVKQAGALPLVGFAAGCLLPWLATHLTADDEIVRPGRALPRALPCLVPVAP